MTDMMSHPVETPFPLPIQLRPLGVTVSYPGFLGHDFNRAGFFHPERMAKLMESCRAIFINFHSMLKQLHSPNRTMVVLSSSYYMLPKFLELPAGKRSFPFTIVGNICNAGTSSFQLEQTLYKSDDMTSKLVTCTTAVVYLNRETRRPADLPGNLRAVVSKREKTERHLVIPDKPSVAHCYEVTIEPSDIDGNIHTNHAVYVRLCSDCAMDAQLHSFYTGFREISAFSITEFLTYYQGESHEGDLLKVFTWPDKQDQNVIHFSVNLKSKPIFYSRWHLGPKMKPLMAKY